MSGLPGTFALQGDVQNKTLRIDFDDAQTTALALWRQLEEIGFSPQGALPP